MPLSWCYAPHQSNSLFKLSCPHCSSQKSIFSQCFKEIRSWLLWIIWIVHLLCKFERDMIGALKGAGRGVAQWGIAWSSHTPLDNMLPCLTILRCSLNSTRSADCLLLRFLIWQWILPLTDKSNTDNWLGGSRRRKEQVFAKISHI